ncbi:D-alanyl-D-alanine dipeptidase [Scandinavium sp. TWS1a]|uniref:D-alanyl-D-alanine dipeptidase n=1 Tax=Scandinavium tedordense TaxID=2926521 RepID=UPI002166614F|nr:D-alanyl-D-alanine dipeptidase [Scandinavium tedordense]MCS2172462.1 D-alanyl-D-alanine dipeptidase [Scandinavium tedordense]
MSEEQQLVDIAARFPGLKIDLKYATADNITGRAIYSEARCLLHPEAAKALEKSLVIADAAGLTLLVLDAYRPQQAQAYLWEACPNQEYVVPLSRGSNHSRGTAIDVTLLDGQGEPLDMGTDFDEMDVLSHPYHPDVPLTAQRNRLLLNAIMFGGGFVGITSEWWHFEVPGAAGYPLLDDLFTCISPDQRDGV